MAVGTPGTIAGTDAIDPWSVPRPAADSGVLCAAPSVTMEFGAYGLVQACCANAMYPIGDVRRQTLDEIWRGDRAEHLRRSLREGDLSTGCGVCRYRMRHSPGELPRNYYDLFGYTGGEIPEYPRILTFSLHNTCNLACVMCGGDESSRIRIGRDGLDPLPHVYGHAFFEQLVPYLQHCEFADFVGGEPFLVREHRRVWDILISQDRPVRCSATTNGTIWNERVEAYLEALDFEITVSVDGMTPETFEAIRVGASHRGVFENIERFRAYTSERGRPFSISWSLTRQNVHEFPQMIEWAEARGIPVKVQTVIEPEFGVQAMPLDDLRRTLADLESVGSALRPHLGLNGDTWDRELRRLRYELEVRSTGNAEMRSMKGPDPANATQVFSTILAAPRPQGSQPRLRVRHLLDPWLDADPDECSLSLDSSGRVVTHSGLPALMADEPALEQIMGTRFDEVLQNLSRPHGGGIWLLEEFVERDLVEHLVFLGRTFRDKRGLILRMVSRRCENDSVTISMAVSHSLMADPTVGHTRAVPPEVSVVLLPHVNTSSPASVRSKMRSTPRVLADRGLNRRLHRDGFVTTPLIDPRKAAELRTRFGELRGWNSTGFHSDLTVDDPAYRREASKTLSDALDAVVRPLFRNYEPFLRNYLCKYPGTQSDLYLHRDWMYIDERKGRQSYVAWIALEDITGHNGQLRVLRGSHRIDDAPRGTELVAPWLEHQDVITRRLVSIPVSAGDCVVFNNALVHSSFPNNSDTPRVAVAVGMVPTDAQLVHFRRSGDTAELFEVDRSFFLTETPQGLMQSAPDLPMVERLPAGQQPRGVEDLTNELDRQPINRVLRLLTRNPKKADSPA